MVLSQAQRCALLLTLGCCVLLFGAMAAAETKTARQVEYELKAAFVYNFMRFIEWPQDKQQANQEMDYGDNADKQKDLPPSPIVIGIVGDDPFGQAFDSVLERKIDNRPIKLVYVGGLEPFFKSYKDQDKALEAYQKRYGDRLNRCDAVFISDSESLYLHTFLPLVAGNAVVTISDIVGFADLGGMIGFVVEKQKMRFDVNLGNVRKERLVIRSQLLDLARRIVDDRSDAQ